MLERFILDQFGDREVLVATKEGLLVMLIPATAPTRAPRTIIQDVGELCPRRVDPAAARAANGASPPAAPIPAPTASPAPTRRRARR